MKKLKSNYKTVSAILLAIIILFSSMNVVKADTNNGGNRMNVVFVLDQSGSMANTDAAALRYEAVDLFLGLATEAGNYMGAVVFDDTIVMRQDITEISGKTSKDELSGNIRGAKSNGDTDIGKALEAATQMLLSSGNKSIPSAIILLSDGNTDLPKDVTGEALKASEQSKQNAIDTARENGIKIYTICLNANGQARPEELRDISDATGGSCVEVRNAEDLKDVFSQFYNIIYSTDTINLADTVIPDSGELEVPFDIPVIGVEEANIIIKTLNADTTYNLINPDGYGYIRAEIEDMEIRAKTFTVIKIQKPKSGQWVLRVRGVSGDQIRIDMVYNLMLSINLTTEETDTAEDQPKSIMLKAQLVNDGNLIMDAQVYQNYPITLAVSNMDNGNIQEHVMEPQSAESTYILQDIEAGAYEMQVSCDVDGTVVKSNTLTYTLEPDETGTKDVDPLPTPEKPKKDKSGILKKVLIVVLAVAAVLAVIFLILYLKRMGVIGKRVIRGRIQCCGYNGGYLAAPTIFEGQKGKMLLGRHLSFSMDIGVELGSTYLMAGEKDDYIYLISKKGYYTDRNPDVKSKKIRLDSGMDVQVSSDIDLLKFLKITYVPNNM